MSALRGMWAARQLRERGLLMELLRGETDYVDSHVVRYAMASLGTPVPVDFYARHVDYLAERGYIAVETRNLGGFRTQLIKITAQGRDLMSGLIEDAGVGLTDTSASPEG